MEVKENATNGVIDMEALTRAFDAELIQQRKGRFGQMLDYVGSHHVIKRLNEALQGLWSFKIVDREVLQDEVIVLGELTAHGISHQQFGSAAITRTKEDNSIVSIGDDLKAAASDCLKKCATQFGVGLHLYGLEAKPNGNGNGNGRNHPQPGEDKRITNDQITKVFQTAKRKGIPQAELLKKVRNTFSKPLSSLSREEGEDLLSLLEREPL